MEKWTPVSVRWIDAHTDYDSRRSIDYAQRWEKADRTTVGWLIHRDRERIVVAMDDDRRNSGCAEDCQTVTTIPAAFIVDVVELRPVRPPRRRKGAV